MGEEIMALKETDKEIVLEKLPIKDRFRWTWRIWMGHKTKIKYKVKYV